MKKRVGIIYSGQMRSNSLNSDYKEDNIILEYTSKHFLNTEFQEKYDYDVFFSVDTIDISKAKEYFKDHLQNVHITESNWYLNEIEEKIPEFASFYDKYLQIDFQGYTNHSHLLYQYYRIFCGYKLLKDYEKKENICYDYLIRIRPDLIIMQDIMPLLDILETTTKQIIMEHEHLYILTRDFEKVFHLIEYYGIYREPLNSIDTNIIQHFFQKEVLYADHIMQFSPEQQLIQHIYQMTLDKQLNWKDVFTGITYSSYELLYRGNGLYGWIDDQNIENWKPFFTIEHIRAL
jgi:hypothetical protein